LLHILQCSDAVSLAAGSASGR